MFNVDMNCAGTEFTTVHVTGPFCGWCGGEAWNTMSDEDGDGVYTLTLYNLEAPLEYKYMIDGFADQETLYDDMAAGASCAPITDYWSYGNRQLDAVGGGLTVSETYGSCMTCDEQAAMLVSTIDFEVDMNGSMYPNADYDNVVLNGDWPGSGPWNGWGLQLSDDDGDGVYTGSLTLDVGTSFEYVVAVTGSADGWSGWGQQFGQPACNGANFTATAPADGNTSTTVSISVDDLVADACGVCDGDDSSCTDDCGVVNGDNSSCADCAGVPYGTSFLDCNSTLSLIHI